MSNPTFQYGRCDTFFVVDDGEAEVQRAVARRRQLESQWKREEQERIGQDLSDGEKMMYGDDILGYLHQLEVNALPDVFSIDMQTEIKWHMRPYLLDFLVEVHQSFGLLPETLFLAVNILDRYCSRRVVFKKHYQLVGCTSLLIAAKYGEASKRVPHIRELQTMCCDQYDEDMFVQMERHVLTNLDWFVGGPTADEFMQIALDDTPPDSELKNMALYISEISLMHRDFVSVRPSEIAKCSLALARIILGRPEPHDFTTPWFCRFDQAILVALSHQLHSPSKVLRNIFHHHALDCVSDKLECFIQRISSQVQQATGPGTPPRQTSGLGAENTSESAYYTPQKNPYAPTMLITPPLTPEGEQFQAAQEKGHAVYVLPSNQVSAPPTPSPEPTSSYCPAAAYLQPTQPSLPSHYFDVSASVM